MKWIKRLLILLVVLFALALLFGWIYVSRLEPDYSEHSTLPSLSSDTEVLYDDYGIPHIYADNNPDAFHTLGYIHAKDRLWQMEVLRRIAPGRLSEIFGASTLGTDKFFRHMQLSKTTDQAVQHYESTVSPDTKAIVEAYLAGINEYVKNGATR